MPTKIKRSQQVSIGYEDIIKLYQQRIALLTDENIKLLAQNQAYAKIIDDEKNEINLGNQSNPEIPNVDIKDAKVAKF
ncbi:hypothetical protein LfeInf_084 [Lactobacillus phage LfeInf]|uniref:Uncharacterized protein n=1 Tax=Lactobacillus phage LfeInf TaxID=1567484 RepID=A0A0A7NNS2_9CAUD|nr:hypothetical protein AXJ15_gp078 [Lactobacillus phage LfeInf]AIZ94710.1 hypothetical protein LfeInf_084 [Lactobacillus phage LfeInf]